MTENEPYAFKRVGARLSNWGRWGADDERGTLNLITDERVREAAALIRTGTRFELSIPVNVNGPQLTPGRAGRVNPIHLMNVLPPDFDTADNVHVTDDYIIMPLQSGTQWDGLAHVGYDGYFYNGLAAADIRAIGGTPRNDIAAALPGVSGRGVLLDIARLDGVDVLGADRAIGADDLLRAEHAHNVRIGSGDILLVRTGWLGDRRAHGWEGFLGAAPGLTLDCAELLHERGVAALAADNGSVEQVPGTDGFLPLHCVLIRDMGMMLGEMFDLDALAEHCAMTGHYDFFFSGAPLRVTGGAGSPVSPLVIT